MNKTKKIHREQRKLNKKTTLLAPSILYRKLIAFRHVGVKDIIKLKKKRSIVFPKEERRTRIN